MTAGLLKDLGRTRRYQTDTPLTYTYMVCYVDSKRNVLSKTVF